MFIVSIPITAPRMPSSRRRKLSKPNSYLGQGSQSFPFLKLPAELRNRIYHLALVPDDPIQLTETVKKNRRHVATRTQRSVLQQRISHNILRTCKQVYYEAAPVLYGQPIEFSDPYGHGQTALVCFLSQIGKHGARMLQTIILDSVKVGKVSAFAHPVFTLLIDAINLKELRINRLYEGNHKSDFPDADVGKLVQLFFPVAHVWLEQMGRSRVDGKDWKDVLSLAQCGQWLNPHWHPLPPFSRAKFYADIDLLCTM